MLVSLAPNNVSAVPVLSGLEAEPASAHEVLHPVGRPMRVCTTQTEPVQVIVGYEGAGRFRRPVYAWQVETRTTCRWENVISYEPRRHIHISEQDCQFYGVTGSAIAGTVAGAPVGGAIGAAVAYEVCQIVSRIIWY